MAEKAPRLETRIASTADQFNSLEVLLEKVRVSRIFMVQDHRELSMRDLRPLFSSKAGLPLQGVFPAVADRITTFEMSASSAISSTSGAPSPSPIPHISEEGFALWLDLLPDEVCTQIARYISFGTQSRGILNLAEASPKQCRAALSALSDELWIDENINFYDVVHWAQIAVPYLATVCMHNFDISLEEPFSLNLHRMRLLESPNLLAASITDNSTLLRTVAHSESLRGLQVDMHEGSEASRQVLFESLTALNLSKLRLECYVGWKGLPCFFSDPAFFRPGFSAIASACPLLSTLVVICHCSDYETAAVDWHFLEGLNALQSIKFCRHPPEEAIPRLQSLSSVTVWDMPDSYSLGLRLGEPLTELGTDDIFDAEQLSTLAVSCPHLSALSFTMSAGSEHALSDITLRLRNLECLRIRWECPSERVHQDTYVSAIPGTVLRAVEFAPSLVNVSLVHVKISKEELTAIMKCIGPSLERFEASLSGQDEPPIHRFETLLLAIIGYNHGIQDLYFTDRGELPELKTFRIRKARAVLLRLQLHAPYLDSTHLHHFLDALEAQYPHRRRTV